jgi:hypothetical protein
VKYALLIYSAAGAGPAEGSAEAQAEFAEYVAFGDYVRERAEIAAGEALRGIDAATTVRVRDGEVLTTDGPFAETKELLGGFYIVEAEDLDQAIEFAGRIPTSRYGSVEVRPVLDFSDM